MTRLLVCLCLILLAFPARADESGFHHWLFQFKQRAAGQGMYLGFLNQALTGVEYKPRVIELDRAQPEHKKTFAQYRSTVVSQKRINDGRKMMQQHHALLNRVSRTYGVPPQYIVALWGIETNYGSNTGGFDTLSALATLAYEGRRSEFFEKELIAALKIMAGGHAGVSRITGSWAGAMGQCQFMPTSYLRLAADGDGDGDRDIWNSLPDVFSSIANYLKIQGWEKDLRWGRQVTLRQPLAPNYYGRETRRPLSEWRRLGVSLPPAEPGFDPRAALIAPDGPGTPTYIVYGNYEVIMDWNRSTYFATSVGLLADAIAAGQ